MSCLLCHSTTRSYFNYGRFTGEPYGLVRCRDCGLVQTEPVPSIEFLSEWYQRYDVLGEREPYYQALASNDPWLTPEGFEIAKRFALVKRSTTNYKLQTTNHLRLLDIGSGPGLFLDLVKRAGWQGIGIELNRRAAERSRARFGIDVRVGIVESVSLEPASFDIVTLWDIFEHVRDPLDLLRRANGLLKTGGLFFIETPRVDALLDTAVMFLAHLGASGPARTFYGPHHLTLWTPLTIKRALQAHGFEVRQSANEFTRAGRVFRGSTLGDRFMRSGVDLIQWLGRLMGRENKMIIVAQKTSS